MVDGLDQIKRRDLDKALSVADQPRRVGGVDELGEGLNGVQRRFGF